jgi:hypothetical protein
MVSFTFQWHYSQGRNPRFQFYRRPGGPQNRSVCGGGNFPALPGIGPRSFGAKYITLLTELSRLTSAFSWAF